MPIIGGIIFSNVVKSKPSIFKFGFVSEEFTNLNICDKFHDNQNCDFNLLSCRFIDFVNQAYFCYQRFEDGYRDLENLKFNTLVNFPSNFSNAMKMSLIDNNIYTNFVLDNRQIEVFTNEVNFMSMMKIESIILDVYKNFTRNLMENCNISSKSGINFDMINITNMYKMNGTSSPKLRRSGPAAFLTFLFCGAASMTFLIFFEERNNGSWFRTIMTGVKTIEIVLTHFIVHFLIGIFQTIIMLILGYIYFPESLGKHTYLIVILYVLMGLCGILFGFFFSCIIKSYTVGSYVSYFTVYIMIFLSGRS